MAPTTRKFKFTKYITKNGLKNFLSFNVRVIVCVSNFLLGNILLLEVDQGGEREREKKRETERERERLRMGKCERERETERKRDKNREREIICRG